MDVWTREILVSLGNGGTLDMAEGVVAFLDTTRSWARGIPVECIGGLSEVADRLGRGKTTVCNWIAREPLSCPQPFAMLAATPLWDLAQWDVWAVGHPDLVGQDQDKK